MRIGGLLVLLLVPCLHAEVPGKELFAGACSACHGPNGEGGHGPSLIDSREVRRETDQELFHSIRAGVAGTDMPPFSFPDEQIRQLVSFVRSLSAPAIDSNPPGDARAGREIFFGKGGCSGCHMIRGEGGFPGPDLSEIGSTRTLAQLRQALLQPDARPLPEFRGVIAITRDGRQIQGVARSSTNYSLAILDARGALHLLSSADLQKVTFQSKSLMPDDYSRRLTPPEIDNVLAFLSSQSMSRRKPE
jgi:cytochrome c oxidase cbb3-type subunit 3